MFSKQNWTKHKKRDGKAAESGAFGVAFILTEFPI